MGSFDISCDRIRPINKMNPHQVHQETELLTFSPIIGQPQRSPLIKKNHGYNKHSQLQRRSPTFLTLKYGFVVFVIASCVATLCDINKLKVDPIYEPEENGLEPPVNGTHSLSNNETTPTNLITDSSSSPHTGPVIIVNPGNGTFSSSYRRWIHHKMKIPLYVYMTISIGILFMAIFGRTVENFFISFGFGLFMLLEIGIMIGLSIKETEFGLGYSPHLWVIYIFQVIFSFAFSAIILIMHHL